ncbi:MAG: TIGR03016 family PEP-CTERM system-associated outer membrane protein [Caldimonas sp.]
MATMGRREARSRVGKALGAQELSSDRTLRRRAIATAACWAAGLPALLAPTCALAEKWAIDAGVSSQLDVSSNASLGVSDSRGDGIIDLRPYIRILGEGAQLKISGSAALGAITYLNGTQAGRIQPEADLNATFAAVPQFLFVDAGVRALQTSSNPFGARPESGTTTENSATTAQVHVMPRIEGRVSDRARYHLSSENSWSHEGGSDAALPGSNASGYFGQHSAWYEQDPVPLGWRIEAQRSETRYQQADQDPLVLDVARATLNYLVGQDFSIGAHVGGERTSLLTQTGTGFTYGLDAKWQPSPRTLLSAFAEKRFFGSSWNLIFNHRTPGFAWSIVTSRTLETAPQSVVDLPASDNVAAQLDQIFTTRFPDPIERARVVQDLIARQGLPTSTLQPIGLQTMRLSVVNLNSATVTLIGVRSTLAATAFQSRTRDAVDTNPLFNGGAQTNNNQYGASIALTHQLNRAYALTGSADWSRIRALDGAGDSQSTERNVRLRLNMIASPRTNVFAGTRYRAFASNTLTSGREVAAFVGLDHRF